MALLQPGTSSSPIEIDGDQTIINPYIQHRSSNSQRTTGSRTHYSPYSPIKRKVVEKESCPAWSPESPPPTANTNGDTSNDFIQFITRRRYARDTPYPDVRLTPPTDEAVWPQSALDAFEKIKELIEAQTTQVATLHETVKLQAEKLDFLAAETKTRHVDNLDSFVDLRTDLNDVRKEVQHLSGLVTIQQAGVVISTPRHPVSTTLIVESPENGSEVSQSSRNANVLGSFHFPSRSRSSVDRSPSPQSEYMTPHLMLDTMKFDASSAGPFSLRSTAYSTNQMSMLSQGSPAQIGLGIQGLSSLPGPSITQQDLDYPLYVEGVSNSRETEEAKIRESCMKMIERLDERDLENTLEPGLFSGIESLPTSTDPSPIFFDTPTIPTMLLPGAKGHQSHESLVSNMVFTPFTPSPGSNSSPKAQFKSRSKSRHFDSGRKRTSASKSPLDIKFRAGFLKRGRSSSYASLSPLAKKERLYRAHSELSEESVTERGIRGISVAPSAAILAPSDGHRSGSGAIWPPKKTNTIKARMQEVSCDLCGGRVHWGCAGADDNSNLKNEHWTCPDCDLWLENRTEDSASSGKLDIDQVQKERCIRPDCILRSRKKVIRKPDDEDQFLMECIIGQKAIGRNNKGRIYEYLVKWQDWEIYDSTWEPAKHIPDLKYQLALFNEKAEEAKVDTQWKVALLPEAIGWWDGEGNLKMEELEKQGIERRRWWE